MASLIKPSHRGLEHERLGVPKGEKIGVGALMKAKKRDKASGNVKGEREDVFALNFGHHHAK